MTTTVEHPSRDERYQLSLEVHRKIEALYPRVEQYRAYFCAMAPVDPVLPKPPGQPAGARLGPVVCALAIKAATTKRAIVDLCELGDGDNSLALARVLLENACLLEWLIRGEGRRRLEAYVMFLSVQHERIAETIERHKGRLVAAGATSEVTSDPYHRAIWTHTFQDTKHRPTRSDRPTWEFDRNTRKGDPVSVRGLFKEIANANDSFEHDLLYGVLGSDIVHSGPFSLLSTQRDLGNRETYVLEPMPVRDRCIIALATSNSAMFLVLDSLTQYMGLDLSAELEQLKAKSREDPLKSRSLTVVHVKSVNEETADALADISREFKSAFELMDEVLDYVQRLLTSGQLKITKKRGLDSGIVYLVTSILAKACKTFRAIRAAAIAGCGQDASILLRALFESTIALLYILQRDSRRRAILFAAHQSQRRLVLIEATKKTPGQKRLFRETDLEKAKASVGQWSKLATTAEVATVRKHWAGPGGLESATATLGRGWPRVYTTMYRYLSAFSHGSDVNAHVFQPAETTTPVFKVLPGTDELGRVIPMACIHMLAMASRFDGRLGLGYDKEINALREKSRAFVKSNVAKHGGSE